jgi:2-dehydropantoate 2-reductase
MAEVVSSLSNLKDGFKIVSMQNGIDNEEYMAKFFPKERILRVVINYAGNAISPSVIKMTFFHKPNYVGCLCGKADCMYTKEFSDLMTDAGLDTEPTVEVKKLAWRKTILVAALAPISALLGMTMAEVMSMGETRYLVEMLLEEAVEVARGKSFDFGDDFIEYSLKYLSTAGHHKPSMLIDVEKGDPTEIEYINGKISFHGHELDIPAHLNTYLTLLVKAKEQFQIRRKNNAI